MKHLKFIFVIGLINYLSMTNLAAFGVEGATANSETNVVTKNQQSNNENVVAEASKPPMESKHIGNPESIEAGRAKYGNTCLFCHGAKGVGARAPTLVAGGFAPGGVLGADHILMILKYGRPGTIMGSYEGILTEDEKWQIIAYLRDQSEKQAAEKK